MASLLATLSRASLKGFMCHSANRLVWVLQRSESLLGLLTSLLPWAPTLETLNCPWLESGVPALDGLHLVPDRLHEGQGWSAMARHVCSAPQPGWGAWRVTWSVPSVGPTPRKGLAGRCRRQRGAREGCNQESSTSAWDARMIWVTGHGLSALPWPSVWSCVPRRRSLARARSAPQKEAAAALDPSSALKSFLVLVSWIRTQKYVTHPNDLLPGKPRGNEHDRISASQEHIQISERRAEEERAEELQMPSLRINGPEFPW